MRSRLSRTVGVAGLLIAATGWTAAGRAAQAQSPALAPVSVQPATAGALQGSIQGAARQSNNAPLPGAVLRLRNVITGKLQERTIADDAGNFLFTNVAAGTYVIELVTRRGKLLVVGQPFTVTPGQTVATAVRLGPKIPWFNGFFNSAASAVASSAASTGVTAIAPEEIPPVSAVR